MALEGEAWPAQDWVANPTWSLLGLSYQPVLSRCPLAPVQGQSRQVGAGALRSPARGQSEQVAAGALRSEHIQMHMCAQWGPPGLMRTLIIVALILHQV